MTSMEELTLIQSIIENTDRYDFVSPQVSVDSTKRREMEASRKYILRQTAPNTQTLTPTSSEATTSSYTITSNHTGGFLNRHPHMLIAQHHNGLDTHFAEVRFEIYGYGTTISYKDAGITQSLALEDPREQRYQYTVDGQSYHWQPLGPSRSVLEMSDEANKRAALFAYAEGVAPQRRASGSGSPKPFEVEDLGEVHIMDDFKGSPIALAQVLSTAAVVVERAKRRASNSGMASWEAVSSKGFAPGHHSGR
ncbi:hypothetical protein MMC28_005543 [Mycoblastus sanguinarius]|nr:hypothetical protein [Mycoblastus sanguinarius]